MDQAWDGLMAALKTEALKMVAEGRRGDAVAFSKRYLGEGKDIKRPCPTFSEQVQAAGGRVVRL